MTGQTIVVADDEPRVISALAQLLESAGHTVVGKASTGEEAIWLTQTLDPELVILDVQMPGMDGLEAAERLMATHPVPVVICTAYHDEEMIASAARIGVFAYVVKPCRLADLQPAMQVALARFHETRLLKGEIDSLKQAIAERKWVERAKGIIMETRSLTEEEAHRFLQRESQRQSRPLSELAQAIVLARDAFQPKILGEGTASRAPA